jgi:hypothetical protein
VALIDRLENLGACGAPDLGAISMEAPSAQLGALGAPYPAGRDATTLAAPRVGASWHGHTDPVSELAHARGQRARLRCCHCTGTR